MSRCRAGVWALALLALLALLGAGCTPLQQQRARDQALSWATCSGLRAAKSLTGAVELALKATDWQAQLGILGSAVLPGVLECAAAEAVRSLTLQHKAEGGLAMMAIEPVPKSDRQLGAERGERWLRERGFTGAL